MTIIKIGYNTYATEKEIAPYEFSTIMGVLGQLHDVRTEWHEKEYYRVVEPQRLTLAVEQNNLNLLSKQEFEAIKTKQSETEQAAVAEIMRGHNNHEPEAA